MVRAQPGYRKGPQGTPSLPRMLPYSRNVRHLEDYYENKDGRYGYCFCGCGEKTNIPNYTNAKRGQFAGEPNTFLPGHQARLMPRRRSLSDEQVEQVRYLWWNSPMTGKEIGGVVGVSASFAGAIARNEKYYDPDYTPPTREERLRIVHSKIKRNCAVCGKEFWISQSRNKNLQQATCLSEECKKVHRHNVASQNSRNHEWTEEERARHSAQAKERWRQGTYDNIEQPKTEVQTRWEGNLPDTKPAYIRDDEWQVLSMHVAQGLPWTHIARALGYSVPQVKYRGKVADRSLILGERYYVKRKEKKPYHPGDPIYGERGKLEDDGELVQCHICGEWFAFMALHVVKTHDMSADEYRKEFGLKQQTSLISEALKDKHRDTSHLRVFDEENTERMQSYTHEQRSTWARAREIRLEQQLDPSYQEHIEKLIEAGIEAVRKAREEGTYVESGWPETASPRSREVWNELLKDPEFHAKWRQSISEAKGGITLVDIECVICGITFQRPPYYKRTTCSDECATERRRQLMLERNIAKRPEVRKKISEAAKIRNKNRARNEKGQYS